MKTILFATDFSEHAVIAGAYAMNLARRLQAELVSIHATTHHTEANPEAYEISRGYLEEFRQKLQHDLAHRRQSLKLLSDQAERQGIRTRHDLVQGAAAEAICQAADDTGAELIVVGSHGRTGLKRMILGSVAERVVRLARTSVLVARSPLADQAGFRHVLVPTDFEEGARLALEQARLLSANDAAIDILHCWFVDGSLDGSFEPGATGAVYRTLAESLVNDAEKQGEEMARLAAGGQRRVTFHLQEGRPAGAIQSFVERQERGYDLVAVGTHGRRGIERLLLGSVAEATVRYSPCSVLVARAR